MTPEDREYHERQAREDDERAYFEAEMAYWEEQERIREMERLEAEAWGIGYDD